MKKHFSLFVNRDGDRQEVTRLERRHYLSGTLVGPIKTKTVGWLTVTKGGAVKWEPAEKPRKRAKRNRCTCPAAVDITFTGHLPGCPEWD